MVNQHNQSRVGENLTSSSAARGTLSWMTSATPDDVNSFAEPRLVGVQDKAVAVGGGNAALQLPPWSVSILKVLQ